MEARTYAEVLAGRLRAARAEAGLGQEAVAERMRSIGFTNWYPQTTGAAENGKRKLSAEEVMGLAWVLGTTIPALMAPAFHAGKIRLRSGDLIPARSVAFLAYAHNDQAVSWDGTAPQFAEDSGEVSVQFIVGPRFPSPPQEGPDA